MPSPSTPGSPLDPDACKARVLAQRLAMAVDQGQEGRVHELLAQGADPFLAPPELFSYTPLTCAANKANPSILSALLKGRELSAFQLAQAFTKVYTQGFSPAHLAMSIQCFEILWSAAGPLGPLAAALAFAEPKSLHDLGAIEFLSPRADFEALAALSPQGAAKAFWGALAAPWNAPSLAKLGPLPLRRAWDAMKDKASLGPLGRFDLPFAFWAAQNNLPHALEWAQNALDLEALRPFAPNRSDWTSRVCAQTPLEMAVENRSHAAFDWLLRRPIPLSTDATGRDRAFRALWILSHQRDQTSPVWDPQKVALALAEKCDPWATDALGETFESMARAAGFEQAADKAQQRANHATPKTAPPSFQARDDAILDELHILLVKNAFNGVVDLNTLSLRCQKWARGLSSLSARHSQTQKTALGIAIDLNQMPLAQAFVSQGASWDDWRPNQTLAQVCSTPAWLNVFLAPLQMERVQALLGQARAQDPEGFCALDHALRSCAPAIIIQTLAPLSDLTERLSQRLLQAAQGPAGSFAALWSALDASSRPQAPAAPHWPEALAERGHLEELLQTERDGAFGPQGLGGRSAPRPGLIFLAAPAANADHQILAAFARRFCPHELDPMGRDALMASLDNGRQTYALALISLSDLSRRDALGESALDKAQIMDMERAQLMISPRVEALAQARQIDQAIPLAALDRGQAVARL